MATRDVQLVVTAKEEASRVFDTAVKAIERLVSEAGDASSSLGQIARAVVAVDAAIGRFGGNLDTLTQKMSRQAQNAADAQKRLNDLKTQMAETAQAAERLQSAIVDKKLEGGDTSKLVAQLTAARSSLQSLPSAIERAESSLSAAQSQYLATSLAVKELQQQQDRLAAASAVAGNAANATTAALRKQAEAAQVLTNIQRSTDSTTGKQASASASVFARGPTPFEAKAIEADARALQGLIDRLNPLDAIQRKLAADEEFLAAQHAKGAITATRYAAMLDQLRLEAQNAANALSRVGRGANGPISLFGLKPYELTNLGYQVNDVVTGLISGQRPMQIIAQQGGQILQLLPGLATKIVSLFSNPAVLGAAAIFAGITISIKEAADQAERLRQVQGILAGLGNSTSATAEQLAAAAQQIERIGVSSEDALGLVRLFATKGLDPRALVAFGAAAQDFADVTGKKIPEAAAEMAEALGNGFKQIAALDDKFPFLTAAEREEIRAMIDSGDAAGARTKAFDAFARVAQKQADDLRGPWASAVKTFDKTWSDLKNNIADTAFAQDALKVLDDLANSLAIATGKTKDLTLAQAQQALANLQRTTNAQGVDGFGVNHSKEITDLQARIADLTFGEHQFLDLIDKESEAQKKRDAEAQREIDFDNARTAAQRIHLAGVKAYNDAVEAGYSAAIAKEKQLRAEQKQRETEQSKFAQNIADNGRQGLLSTAQQFVGRNENRASDRGVLQDFFKAANVNVDPKITAWCAAFVNAVLATNGLPTVNQATGGSNVRAKDFLSFGSAVTKPEPGDIVILKGAGRGGGHVGFFQGFTDNGDVRVLGGNQSNGVNTQTFKSSQVLGFRRAPSQADVATQEAKAAQDLAKAQEALNNRIDDEIDKRRTAIDSLIKEAGLSGTALLDAQREAAVQKALADARAEAHHRGQTDLEISKDRLDTIRKTVEAEFDLQHARERATAAINDATTLRDPLLGKLGLAEQNHDQAGVTSALEQLRKIDDALKQAIRSTIAFFEALGTPDAKAQANLQNLRNQIAQLDADARQREQQAVEKPVGDLQAQHNAILDRAQGLRDVGQSTAADELLKQLPQVDAELDKAIDKAIEFWKAQTGPEAQAAILNLQNLKQQVQQSENQFIITAKQIQDAFADSLSSSVELFAQKLVETRNPLKALGIAALSFAADFTKQLAEMGLKILAFKLATKLGFGGVAKGFNQALGLGNAAALSAAGSTVAAGGLAVSAGATALGISAGTLLLAAHALTASSAVRSFASVGTIAHGGGIIGQLGASRRVSPLWFAAALRYHSGGVAGLRPDEVPTILQRGEEVITRNDVRHRFNGGGAAAQPGGGGGEPISQILAIGEDQIANAMRSASGRKVILTHIRTERETVRAILNQ